MARIYAGGVVAGTPELTHGQTGTSRVVFKLRDERNPKFPEEYVVETWGPLAETFANTVVEGMALEVKGFPRADGRLDAEGKPRGVLVVKVTRAEDLEVTSRPQVTAAQAGAAQPGDDLEDDPFGNQ